MKTLSQSLEFVIIETNIEYCYQLRQQLFDKKFLNVNIYNNASQGIEAIRIQRPDVVFLDIGIDGDLSGVDILKIIQASKIHTHVIVLSSSYDCLSEVIHYSPIDFLLKPFKMDELSLALTKVEMHNFIHESPANVNGKVKTKKIKLIVVNSNQEVNYYQPENIAYIQADGSYSQIFMTNGKYDTVCQNMGKLSAKLPANQFVRISRKSIVNVNCIRKLDKKSNELWLEYGNKNIALKTSRKYLAAFDS